MSEFNFKIPSQQSLKGIVFLLLPSLAKVNISTFIPLVFVVIQIFRKPNVYVNMLPYIFAGIFLLLIFYLTRSILLFQNFKFSISNNHFILSQGIVKKKRIEIPFHKIQNVHIKQNLIHRFINVVEVNIDTAGDNETEITIKALDQIKAIALKNILLDNKNVKESIAVNENILKISFSELLLVGITQNHFNSLYILSALIFGLLIDFRDVMQMIGYENFIEDLKLKSQVSISYPILVFGTLVGIAIFISIAYSVLKVVINNYKLKLVQKTDEIEIRKGLFNRISYSLNSSKVQSITYSTNLLKKRFGLFNLRFNQAMSNQQSKKNIEIVGVRKPALKTLEQFVFGYEIDKTAKKRKPDPYFKIQLFLNTAYPLVLINVLAISLLGFEIALVNLVFIPWLFLLNFLRYRKSYYILHEDYMVLGKGRIDTLTNIFEHHKIQSLKVEQNFFQKRKQVANIKVYTASNSISIPAVPYTEAIELYNYVLYKIEISNKNWI